MICAFLWKNKEERMKNILVIEDDEDIRIMMSLFLKSENFAVTLAENGRVGLELAKKHKPDLILSDIHMPELDGYEVLKALREDAATANIKFIFVTSEVNMEAYCLALELGADDYLTKPLNLKHLLQAIALQLNGISDQTPPTCGIEYCDVTLR